MWQATQRGLCVLLPQSLHTLDVIVRILKLCDFRVVRDSTWDQGKAAGGCLLQAHDSHATQKSEDSLYRGTVATGLACTPHTHNLCQFYDDSLQLLVGCEAAICNQLFLPCAISCRCLDFATL
jgi:hypothetical protein